MKKIALSLMTIAVVVTFAVGATSAYFTDVKRINDNVFATGNVTLDTATTQPIVMSNLIPGQTTESNIVQAKYVGTTPADIYFGLKAQYGADLKDSLQLKVDSYTWNGAEWVSPTTVVNWQSVTSAFAAWQKISDNTAPDSWLGYKVSVFLNPAFELENQSTTSQLIIYAVQHGGPVPTTAPWQY